MTCLGQKLRYIRVRQQNASCSTRDLDSCVVRILLRDERLPLHEGINVEYSRHTISRYLTLALGTPRSVSRSNNNLKGITYGIRLVLGLSLGLNNLANTFLMGVNI